jgi:hypothetical protein
MVVAQVLTPVQIPLQILKPIQQSLLRQMAAAQERPTLPIKARTRLGVQLFLVLLVLSVSLL